jgi:hypothetical protein
MAPTAVRGVAGRRRDIDLDGIGAMLAVERRSGIPGTGDR